MKKLLAFAFAALILAGCTKNDEPIPEITFTISVSGFNITTDDFGSLKSSMVLFDGFEHKYLGGILEFTAPSGAVYTFDTNGASIEGFTLSLSPGTYSLTGYSELALYAGRDAMSFNIAAQDITITESTTSIDVVVTPTSGLILVLDASDQVATALIRPVTPPPSWDLFTEADFYFTYFAPRADHYLEIAKTNGSTLTMHTNDLQVGYAYQIEVTDAAGSLVLGLDATFTEAETVVW